MGPGSVQLFVGGVVVNDELGSLICRLNLKSFFFFCSRVGCKMIKRVSERGNLTEEASRQFNVNR